MLVILIVIWLFCGIQICRKTGIDRFFYFYMGILLVPATVRLLPTSFLVGHMFFATTFFLSMILHEEFTVQNFLECPFSKALFFVFLSCLLIGFFDSRVGPFVGVSRGITNFLGTYFLFYVGWFSLREKNMTLREADYSVFYKLIPVILIVTIYGLVTAVIKVNPALDAVGLAGRFFEEEMLAEGNYRAFRVTGFTVSSSVYGLACSVLFLVFLSTRKNVKGDLARKLVLFLLFVNVLLSATRAAIIPFFVGLFVFLLLDRGTMAMFRSVLVASFVVLIGFFILPSGFSEYINQLIASIVDVLSPQGTGGAAYGGSNLEAREIQIATAFQFLKERPLFGHGFAYFGEVLSQGESHPALLGMESYLCFIGVEYGLIYFVSVLIFLLSLTCFFGWNRQTNKVYSDLGLSLICMFIPYLVFAWVGGCWFFILPVLGYVARLIYLNTGNLL